jgi:hypothetical protein
MNLSLPMIDTLEEVPAEGAAYGPEPMPTADVVGHGDSPDSNEQRIARLESQTTFLLKDNSELRNKNNLSTEREAMLEENLNYQRWRVEELEKQLQQTQRIATSGEWEFTPSTGKFPNSVMAAKLKDL